MRSRHSLAVLLLGFGLVFVPAAEPDAQKPARAEAADRPSGEPLLLKKEAIEPTDPFDRVPTRVHQKSYDVKMVGGRSYLVDMTSTAFVGAATRVEDPTGQPLTPVSSAGLPNGIRRRYVPKDTGTYRVVATSIFPTALGAYTLSVREPDGDPFEVADSLIDSDPRETLATNTYCKRYPYKMTQGAVYVIEATSPGFDTQVRVEDSAGAEVAANRALGGARRTRVVFVPERTDTFTIIATSSYPLSVGPFSLTVRRPADAADAVLIDKATSLEETDPFDQAATRNRRKVYEQDFDAEHAYVLELESSAFQPYLRVEDAEGNPLAQAGDARVARLVFAPARTATYRVIATTRDADKTGPFTLRILGTDDRESAARRVSGKIAPLDPLQRLPTAQYCKKFESKLRGGQRYEIEARSPSFAPRVCVEGPDGRFAAESAAGSDGSAARVSFTPAADDTYTIIVASAADERTGPFTLRVLTADAQAASTPLDGAPLNDQAPRDAYPTRKRYKAYPVKLSAGTAYQIDMTSSQVDSFLYLQSADDRLLAQDDDGGEGDNARLRFTAQVTAEYTIIASGATAGAVGKFSLQASPLPLKAGQAPVLDKQEELTGDYPYYVVPTLYPSRSCDLDMKEGLTYLIRTEGKGVDPYVRLEDGRRSILAETGSTPGAPAILLFRCKKTASYHLVAGATQAQQSGSVTVRVEPLAEAMSEAGRLEATDARLTLPTPWRRAELTQPFEAGASCLVELASPQSDAGLTIEAGEAAPSPTRAEELPGASRIAFTPERGGDYRLAVLAKAAGPFTVLIRPLKKRFERAEALTQADAVDSQPTQRRRKTATARLPADQLCAVVAESQAFEPLVRVLDARGQEIARTETRTSGGTLGLFTPTGDGPHTVVMTSRDTLQTGPVRVRLMALTTGLDKSDRLAADDPLDRRETGKVCKIYDHAMKPDVVYLASLSSTKFQSQLRLEDSRGRSVAASTAPFDGPILIQPHPSETYRLVVTSASAGQFGPFKLSVQPFTASLTQTDSLTAADPIDRVQTPRRCKVYEQELEKGKTYILQMTGEKLTPFLRLEDGQGAEVRQQIGGAGVPARIVFFPERSQTCKIIASSAVPGQTGAFSLQVSAAQETFSETGKLGSDDQFDPLQNQSFQKIHAMKLKAGVVYVFHLESTDFQPFLRLDTSRGRHVRIAPDVSAPHSARIVFTPDQDDAYQLIVTTVNAQGTGAYRLWREE